jgi:hypothetical protein
MASNVNPADKFKITEQGIIPSRGGGGGARGADYYSGMKPYKADYRGEKSARYDPRYYDVKTDELKDDAGNVVATKEVLVPKPGVKEKPDIEGFGEFRGMPRASPRDPDLEKLFPDERKVNADTMFRGMSAGEYEEYLKTGELKSKGEWNIADSQKGTTSWSPRAETAEMYSNSFAPPEFVPDVGKPAYIVQAKAPQGEERARSILANTPDEYSIRRPITKDDILHAWRGDVIARDEGINTSSFKSKPSARLNWKQLFALLFGTGAAADYYDGMQDDKRRATK